MSTKGLKCFQNKKEDIKKITNLKLKKKKQLEKRF